MELLLECFQTLELALVVLRTLLSRLSKFKLLLNMFDLVSNPQELACNDGLLRLFQLAVRDDLFI